MASGDRQNTGQKPTVRKAKQLSQKEQSARFIETARALKIDESGVEFEKVVKRVIRR